MKDKLSPWLKASDDREVEMSLRIRLARNIAHLPFPQVLKDETTMDEVLDKVEQTLSDFNRIRLDELSYEDKWLMVEKHLISPNFVKEGHTCFINNDESVSIMINEEDHFRIQAMGTNVDLHDIYKVANDIDEAIESVVTYAFDENYGLLTACPTNVGTGLRASVMLHLPALSTSGRLERLAGNLSRFGFTIRGIYGEGSTSLGYIYQLSNQMTLGQTEADIIDHLIDLKDRLIEEELDLRDSFLNNHELETRDIVFRALGTLKYAQMITLKEAAKALSDIKTGVDLEVIHLENFNFQELIQLIQPAFIKMLIDEDIDVREVERKINERRATLLRNLIGG